jgi:hypothetical protein
MVVLWGYLPPVRRLAFVVWAFLVGTSAAPGLVQAIRFTPRLGWLSWTRMARIWLGLALGVGTLARSSRTPQGSKRNGG